MVFSKKKIYKIKLHICGSYNLLVAEYFILRDDFFFYLKFKKKKLSVYRVRDEILSTRVECWYSQECNKNFISVKVFQV